MTSRDRHAPPGRLLAAVTALRAMLLVGLVAASLGLVRPAQAADTSTTRTPLQVSIDTLAPAVIPQTGRVTLTGTITNRSHQTWTGLKAYLLTSLDPITTRADLARAAATDPAAEVGNRLTDDGLFQSVGDLAPGASVPYRLSLRRRDLGISGAPGVYWVGVHVLGAIDGIRDSVADGRARTFMPLMPTGAAAAARDRTQVSLLLPLRAPVRRGTAGRLLDVPGWAHTMGTDGRLDRLLRLSRHARSGLTWVVDPAVVDAAASLAHGNPSADPAPAAGSGTGSSGGSDAATTAEARTAGRQWLADLRQQASSHTVLALPYGDLDVSATLGAGRTALYTRARALSAGALQRNGVAATSSVVDPVSGYLSPEAADRVPGDTPVVLGQQAVPSASGPVADLATGSSVVVTDGAAGSGGPLPDPRYSALAVRQRLLGDAALHALSTDRDSPLVVALPARWDPGAGWGGARFFEGLDQPWLQLVDLPAVVAGGSTSGSTSGSGAATRLTYPSAVRRLELPEANLAATAALVRAGTLFARVLTGDDTVDDAFSRVAMLASSATTRKDPEGAAALAGETLGHVRDQLGEVRVEGPPFVMMSGQSGPIQVSLVNDLDRTVTVGLQMSTPASDLAIAKVAPVRLGPGKRASLRLNVSSHGIGVHAVTLRVTDADGVPLGSRTRFNVRTSHVSTVIWVVMAVGGALLLVAIAIRLFRRVRRRKSTHGPRLPQSSADPAAGPAAAVPGQGLNA